MSRVRLYTKAGELQIRRAGPEDIEALMLVMIDVAGWLAGRGIDQWRWVHSEKGAQTVRKRIEEQEAYVAFLDGEPVATITLQWDDKLFWGEKGLDKKAGYIHGVAVKRKIAGQGVGKDLIEWATREIVSRGRRFVRLDYIESNSGLCGYYQGLGFEQRGTREGKGWSVRLYEKCA